MITRIRTFPRDEKALRTRAARVASIASVAVFAAELVEWMHREDGLGLAANQVESEEFPTVSPAIFALAPNHAESLVLVNPEIVFATGAEVQDEGCLSFGGVVERLPAPTAVKLRFTYLDGDVHEQDYEGLLARCVAHEVDHLSGKLMIDRMVRWQRRVFLRKLQAALGSER